MKVVALGVEVLAVILSGFNVFSENGIICEALGIPFTTGLICIVTGRLESFAEKYKLTCLRNTPIG